MNQVNNESPFIRVEEEICLSGSRVIDLLHSVLEKKAAFRFQVKGFSMFPFIKDGDILTISAVNKSSMRFGRISAFVHPGNGKLAIHRIIGMNKGGYLLKGDNIFDIDGTVSRENILGTVSSVQRSGRSFTFGLGWERVIIAFLSRMKIFPLALRFWSWNKQLLRIK